VSHLLPWLVIALLGAYHGINPAMGWLFAVALGLQRRSRRAVLEALAPIAFGHEASVTLTVALVGGASLLVAPDVLRTVGAAALIAFGAFKLARPGAHPRWVGMNVSFVDLIVWSFLMSTAHGAGLMLFPVLLGLPVPTDPEAAVGTTTPVGAFLPEFLVGAAAVAIHTLAMLVVMTVVSLVVYDKIGVGILRRAWFNLDKIWAGAVVTAGVVTLFT
jgi:hypothetical protein